MYPVRNLFFILLLEKKKKKSGFKHDFNHFLQEKQGAIAKWLRRQIRNLFLFEGAGSNPAGVGCSVVFVYNFLVPLTGQGLIIASDCVGTCSGV